MSGPLTAAIGDLVATERGYVPLSLEGFSEDLNEDGFVDPIAPAVAAPVAPVVHAAPVVAPAVAAPLVHAAPAVQVAAPVQVAAAPVAAPAVAATVVKAAPAVQVAAPVVNAPFINNFFHAAPFAAAPFVAPAAPAVAVAHAPVVKSVVEEPATVSHEVHAAPLVHHIPAPVAHVAAPVAAHVPFVPRSHVIKPFVQF